MNPETVYTYFQYHKQVRVGYHKFFDVEDSSDDTSSMNETMVQPGDSVWGRSDSDSAIDPAQVEQYYPGTVDYCYFELTQTRAGKDQQDAALGARWLPSNYIQRSVNGCLSTLEADQGCICMCS